VTSLVIFGIDAYIGRVLLAAEAGERHTICAFVDERSGDSLLGRPVLSLDQARSQYPRDRAEAFACLDERFLNQERLALYMHAKRSGYRIASIVSEAATVAADVRLRENVLVEAGARVLPGVSLGANAWVGANATLGANVHVGSSCWLAPGCVVEDGARIGKNCTIGSGVIIRRGVEIPPWSLLNRPGEVIASPRAAVFQDALFRSDVTLHVSGPIG
jgi:hypothetical protein